jgi:hypothetical protein
MKFTLILTILICGVLSKSKTGKAFGVTAKFNHFIYGEQLVKENKSYKEFTLILNDETLDEKFLSFLSPVILTGVEKIVEKKIEENYSKLENQPEEAAENKNEPEQIAEKQPEKDEGKKEKIIKEKIFTVDEQIDQYRVKNENNEVDNGPYRYNVPLHVIQIRLDKYKPFQPDAKELNCVKFESFNSETFKDGIVNIEFLNLSRNFYELKINCPEYENKAVFFEWVFFYFKNNIIIRKAHYEVPYTNILQIMENTSLFSGKKKTAYELINRENFCCNLICKYVYIKLMNFVEGINHSRSNTSRILKSLIELSLSVLRKKNRILLELLSLPQADAEVAGIILSTTHKSTSEETVRKRNPQHLTKEEENIDLKKTLPTPRNKTHNEQELYIPDKQHEIQIENPEDKTLPILSEDKILAHEVVLTQNNDEQTFHKQDATDNENIKTTTNLIGDGKVAQGLRKSDKYTKGHRSSSVKEKTISIPKIPLDKIIKIKILQGDGLKSSKLADSQNNNGELATPKKAFIAGKTTRRSFYTRGNRSSRNIDLIDYKTKMLFILKQEEY